MFSSPKLLYLEVCGCPLQNSNKVMFKGTTWTWTSDVDAITTPSTWSSAYFVTSTSLRRPTSVAEYCKHSFNCFRDFFRQFLAMFDILKISIPSIDSTNSTFWTKLFHFCSDGNCLPFLVSIQCWFLNLHCIVREPHNFHHRCLSFLQS